LEKADLVILAGCDLEVEHPIVGLRIKKMINKGVPVYSIGSRKMTLGRFNITNIITKPGEEHLAIAELLKPQTDSISKIIESEIYQKLLAQLKAAKNIQILSGGDFIDNTNRKSFYANLKSLSDTYTARLSILSDESNFIGVRIAAQPNFDLEQIIEKAEQGKIKTLFVAGGNPANIYPDRQRILAAFKKIDYVIYWGAYANATADLASLIFPQALPTETAGSFVNIERRLQFMKEAYPTDRAITSLIKLFTEFKIELGGQTYYSPREIFAMMSKSIKLFSGLEYESAEGAVLGCDTNEIAKQQLTDTPIQPPAEYPLVLTFAKSVYYGASGMTIRSQVLSKLMPPQTLVLAPTDASGLGLKDNEKVTLATSRASGEFVLAISDTIDAGQIILSGFSIENPPNKFMNGHSKPVYARIAKIG
jgi:predicted molibdopterin-dependent oxidoreductase YjgC